MYDLTDKSPNLTLVEMFEVVSKDGDQTVKVTQDQANSIYAEIADKRAFDPASLAGAVTKWGSVTFEVVDKPE